MLTPNWLPNFENEILDRQRLINKQEGHEEMGLSTIMYDGIVQWKSLIIKFTIWKKTLQFYELKKYNNYFKL